MYAADWMTLARRFFAADFSDTHCAVDTCVACEQSTTAVGFCAVDCCTLLCWLIPLYYLSAASALMCVIALFASSWSRLNYVVCRTPC